RVRAKYFRGDGREYQLDGAVRTMATFEERNLAEEDRQFWQSGIFDVVFCRNVTMYFTAEVTRAVISRVARSLAPGGFLFLGHAETLRAVSQEFHLRHTHETFYYQLREREETNPMADASELGPTSSRVQRTVQERMENDESWFGTIRRASERIANL